MTHVQNRLGSLHGGVISSLIDIGGSLAVASKGLYSTGVTVDLNSTFISSAGGPGNKVFVNCRCDKLGRTLAYTSVEFRDSRSRLVARGSHTKYIVQALRDVSIFLSSFFERGA
jgi:acyl-coenzyme A thioesterase 13